MLKSNKTEKEIKWKMRHDIELDRDVLKFHLWNLLPLNNDYLLNVLKLCSNNKMPITLVENIVIRLLKAWRQCLSFTSKKRTNYSAIKQLKVLTRQSTKKLHC